MAAYLVTVFLGSFLLFQVEPLIGRYILPWFGGSPAVWTSCMLFFQGALLAGYGYAHALTAAKPKMQAVIHLAALAAALAFLPIAPSAALWKKSATPLPAADILMLLTVTIGVPFVVLSATAPLVQYWFARACPERSPYRLYALSNAASLLALVSYPFLVEPNLTLRRQVVVWSWQFFIFVLCCGWCAVQQSRAAAGERAPCHPDPVAAGAGSSPPGKGISAGSVSLWLTLSACGSAALLAATNQVCQEVAVVPFLWIAPLTLYLASFIICFNSDRAYHRAVWQTLFIVSAVPACWILGAGTSGTSLPVQLAVFLGVLFSCCMACHGELARSRPPARHLTAYYLAISTGGVIGGVFVAVIAPVAFNGYWEFPIVLTLSAAALSFAYRHRGALQPAPPWLPAGAAAAALGLAIFTVFHITATDSGTVARSRNFYGVLRVVHSRDRKGPLLYLLNGRVLHGFQYSEPPLRRTPTTYYAPESGIGLALRFHPRRGAQDQGRALRVGIVGLGTGTLAAYGERGDIFRFYEINNDVIAFADRYFTFRRDSRARIETVPGDARIVLESELARGEPQRFDILAVDAFTSDSIPVHLLTRESFGIYRRHLAQDGLLLIHVTNHYLDLVPVVAAHARQMGLQAATVESGREGAGSANATWVIVTANREFLGRLEVKAEAVPCVEGNTARQWTDDFVSLWRVVKW